MPFGETRVPETCLSAVTIEPGKTQIHEFVLPTLGEGDGLLEVEAVGVCGSDWPFFAGISVGQVEDRQPRIQGHHTVGRVAKLGKEAMQSWGVREGDRVAVEEFLPCGHCAMCRTGNYRLCNASDPFQVSRPYLRYGHVSTSVAPSLWGGYGQYMYLHPSSVLYKVAEHVPTEITPLFIPIANGIRWMRDVGGVRIGDTVVIEGPGQHGLGCVVAAKEAGASCIIVTGLTQDSTRFEIARSLGAHYTIDVQKEDVVERVHEITNGELADLVIDISAGVTEPITVALKVSKKLGTVLLAGLKYSSIQDFDTTEIYKKELTVRGVRGHDLRSVIPAIKLIESGKYPLQKMVTHTYTLNEVGRALSTIGGKGDVNPIHLTVMPNSESVAVESEAR